MATFISSQELRRKVVDEKMHIISHSTPKLRMKDAICNERPRIEVEVHCHWLTSFYCTRASRLLNKTLGVLKSCFLLSTKSTASILDIHRKLEFGNSLSTLTPISISQKLWSIEHAAKNSISNMHSPLQ
jgi:hypothetical protein